MFGFRKKLDEDYVRFVRNSLGLIKCCNCKHIYFKEDLNVESYNYYCDRCYSIIFHKVKAECGCWTDKKGNKK